MSNMCLAFFKRSSANVVSSNSPTKSPLTPPASVIFTREWSPFSFCYSSLDTSYVLQYIRHMHHHSHHLAMVPQRGTQEKHSFREFCHMSLPHSISRKIANGCFIVLHIKLIKPRTNTYAGNLHELHVIYIIVSNNVRMGSRTNVLLLLIYHELLCCF